MFRHVSEHVVLPASRKLAELQGEAEGVFWSKEYWTTLIYMYVSMHILLTGHMPPIQVLSTTTWVHIQIYIYIYIYIRVHALQGCF